MNDYAWHHPTTFSNAASLYAQRQKSGRSMAENSTKLPQLRVALLADYAIQQLALVLKAEIYDLGYFPVLYEAEYGTMAIEVFDTKSKLYTSEIQVAILGFAMQKYRDKFYNCTETQKSELPTIAVAEVMAMVEVLTARGIKAVVCNLAVPIERQFGNFSALTEQSLWTNVLAFNSLLTQAIQAHGASQLVDLMYLSSQIGAESFSDERLWQHAKFICSNRHLPTVAKQMARVLCAQAGRLSKCIVLDLDNTLWGGVIGDDGIEGIELGGGATGEAYVYFQQYILSLKARGFILTVCSKNNHDTAMLVFKKHPDMVLKETDIAVFVANWGDKATNIEYIARTLNIGLDALIFIDDSSFERNQVRAALPTVFVPEMPDDVSQYIAAIEISGALEATGYSSEDGQRNTMYRMEAQRSTELLQFNDIDTYLQSLNMQMQCAPFNVADLARVVQLMQRSNQFNLRTQRLSMAQCQILINDATGYTIQARLSDKFGDYGLICAIASSTQDNWLNILEWVMSCRVLKRGVEDALIAQLFLHCKSHQLNGIRGEYIPTSKNKLVEGFYKDMGFSLLSGSTNVWELSCRDYLARKNYINTNGFPNGS